MAISNEKPALIFPGQGAQYVGMGKDFYDNFSIAKETFQEADDILNSHFTKLIFEGPKEELMLTKNSQPAIFVMSMAIWKVLSHQLPDLKPAVTSGLSLGEYTALAASGKVSFTDCLKLVQRRAELMQQACVDHPGTMRVVLGMESDEVEKIIVPLSDVHDVWLANMNCPGQVVISGTYEGMEEAEKELKEKGAKRVLPLDVSGAFHSGLMLDARIELEPAISDTKFLESDVDFVMNVPGDYVKELELIRRNLTAQVTEPVRWEKGIRAMEAKSVTHFFEIGPGKTLTGMNRKIGVSAQTLNVDKVADLEHLATEWSKL